MNDNYLWDKSGEPDEEIQHLESLLSDFRYQPRPFVVPEEAPKKMIFSMLSMSTLRYGAIAALALLTLGIGLWYGLRSANEVEQIAGQPQQSTPAPTVAANNAEVKQISESSELQTVKHAAIARPIVRKPKVIKRATDKQLELEGEMAKEKVLYALQLTSKQLDVIARKIQTDTN